jgi:hypothetical protein
MPPKFTKFHGLGNDYLVIEADQLTGIDDLGEFARRICNRHYGAAVTVSPSSRSRSLRTLISTAASSILTAAKPDFPATALVAPSLISTMPVIGRMTS